MMKVMRFLALGSGSNESGVAGAAAATAATGCEPKSTLPTPTPKRGSGVGAGWAITPGSGGGGALVRTAGAGDATEVFAGKPSVGKWLPENASPAATGGAPDAAISLPVRRNFGSSGGAALQPNTVQPPFSAKQSE